MRFCGGFGGLEGGIAGRRRQAVPGGWIVIGELQGWQFRVEPTPGGLRISAGEPGAAPAVWVVTG